MHLGGAEARFIEPAASVVVHRFEDQKRERDGLGDVVWLPARGVAPEARADVVAFLARVRGSADIGNLLEHGSALRSLPLQATQPGVRFDPKLRAKLAPKQQRTVARPRHELADEF